ncbi:MAG: four-carbon acid sugar kinase family protein [Fervidicoccaceae archaeon]
MFGIFKKALILADDYTGGSDTAVQFSKAGYKVSLTSDLKDLGILLRESDVVAYSTESRNIPPRDAKKKIEEAIEIIREELKSIGIRFNEVLFYKKIDSTLRGNILEEVAEATEKLGADIVVFSPALPKQGRTTINGVHLVSGLPVSETYFGKDPRSPTKSSRISWYLSWVKEEERIHFTLEDLRIGGEKDLCSYKAISSDIETDEDLDIFVKTVGKCARNKIILWVGSAGMAEALLRNTLIYTGSPKLLFCIGSINEVTRKQMRILIETEDVDAIKIDLEKAIKNATEEEQRVIDTVRKSKKRCVLITSSLTEDQIDTGRALAGELKLNMSDLGYLIAKFLGKVCSDIIKKEVFGGVFMSGGDISASVMKQLGSTTAFVIGEIEPGIPLMQHIAARVRFATKAGGFGDDFTLIRVLYRL